ncbi:MAG: MBOAT family O-acyltransferase [Saprospiraceae bacterium]
MLFNSIDFALFLPLVFALYWAFFYQDIKWRNVFLLAASYLFYGWWDGRFLFLILFSSLVDYGVGLALHKTESNQRRKQWLALSLVVNLGLLGYFKYANFFITAFVDAFSILGTSISPWSLQLILPVGISFYTFQTLSYTIDVYRRKIAPTRDIWAFLAYVSFFPQLVAGPIERAASLLPQFGVAKKFDYIKARAGLQLILWGLFKKMVVADNCAYWVDTIFGQVESQSSLVLVLGAVLFAFQIYGDFSGYSDIAIGTARLFGFELRRNFAYPYFSRDVAEFWRRWHISLSSWFRDYLYIPLGGSRGSKGQQVRNVLIVFVISGFWHGANWTFIVWGGLNGLLFLPLILWNRNRRYLDTVANKKWLPGLKEGLNMLLTFGLVSLAWVFFRSASVQDAWLYLVGIGQGTWGGIKIDMFFPVLAIIFMLVLEWCSRTEEILVVFQAKNYWVRWSAYFMVAMAILLFAPSTPSVFIYFQF